MMASDTSRPAGRAPGEAGSALVFKRSGNVTKADSRLQAASRSIENALRLLPVAGNPGFSEPETIAANLAGILRKRLGPVERMMVAGAGLMAMDAEEAEELAEVTLADLRAGPPVPSFDGVRAEARWWSEWASPAERKAYLAACWQRTPEPEQAKFIRAAKPKRRAVA